MSDGTQIEYISEIKLENLRWQKNSSYICDKARQKMWMLRRMVKLDLDVLTMYDVYTKEVRSILELAVPVWHSGLTKTQSKDIERIQRISFQIILGPKYTNYTQACQYLSAQTLQERRVKLCLKFARKNLKSEQCMFTKVGSNLNTRQRTKLVREYKCKTSRYQKSSLPYLAKLLNKKAWSEVTVCLFGNNVTCG